MYQINNQIHRHQCIGIIWSPCYYNTCPLLAPIVEQNVDTHDLTFPRAGWSDWLNLLYGLISCISYTRCYFKLPKSWPYPSLPNDLHRHVGPILIFLEGPFLRLCLFMVLYVRHSEFHQCTSSICPSASFTGNAIDAIYHLLCISFQSGSHEWTL
jgi:hypothetical protein